MTVTEPKLVNRDGQYYVAIRTQATRQDLASILPLLFGEVFAWLKKNGVATNGAPFCRYIFIDMEANFVIDVGVPVKTAVPVDGRISFGILPAGRYAVLKHTGPYGELHDATAALLAWAQENNIVWQTSENGKAWGARVEYYLTDPNTEPVQQNSQTELAFLLEDAQS